MWHCYKCDIRCIYFEDEIKGSESYYAYGLLWKVCVGGALFTVFKEIIEIFIISAVMDQSINHIQLKIIKMQIELQKSARELSRSEVDNMLSGWTNDFWPALYSDKTTFLGQQFAHLCPRKK